MDDLRPNCRIWIYSPSRPGVFGDGKLRLLKEIADKESLSKAAKKLKISYRKAWGDLNKAEVCLNVKLIKKTRGGKKGGRTVLTPEGERIIASYERFQKKVRGSLAAAFGDFEKNA